MLLVPIADHDLRVAGVKFAAMPMLSIYPVLAQRHILFPSQPPSFVDAGFRDDLVASGHAPTSLIVATTGNRVAAAYSASDEGVPNWIDRFRPAAPVYARSNLTSFTTGSGFLGYGYSSVATVASGGVDIEWFMPSAVPEGSTAALLAAGLLLIGLRLRGPLRARA